ncbi:MAG TPA: hypothetical protein VLC09_06410 [Polyangiaceae bacterium]|nr:hypothetical protein [Polyangiaceae bacterium]
MGSGGGQALIEPDLDEECTVDPRADDWVEGTHEEGTGSEVIFGGATVLLRILVDDGFRLVAGRVSATGFDWGEPISFGAEVTFDAWGVDPDGEEALFVYTEQGTRKSRYFTSSSGTWSAATPLQAELQGGGIALTMLPGQRALLVHAGELRQIEERVVGSPISIPDYFGKLFRSSATQTAQYYEPSLVDEPHHRVEYTWGVGYGSVGDLPAFVATDTTWATASFETAAGVGVRIVSLWAAAAKRGLYVHTRRNGSWDAGTRLTDYAFDGDYLPSFSQAGTDLLFVDAGDDNLQVRTSSASGWNTAEALPRSRAVEFIGAAGDVAGGALVVGDQTITAENVRTTKLYRRNAAGTWLCPRLLPQRQTTRVLSDDQGNYLIVGSAYQEPLQFWWLTK